MKTLILIDEDRAYARTDDKKMIRRWKRCTERSKTPTLVLEDTIDQFGHETYSIEIPFSLARKAAALLIPQMPEKVTEGERLAALTRINDALIPPEKINNAAEEKIQDNK